MGHHHDGDREHGHEADQLPFCEKAAKLLQHWQHHNDDHAGNYYRWADAFRQHEFPEAAALLEAAAELTRQINQVLNEAHQLVSAGKE